MGRARGHGQLVADEPHIVWTGRGHRADVPTVPIIAIHGAGGNADQFLPPDWAWPRLLADRGFVVASADYGGAVTMGNQPSLDTIDEMVASLAVEYGTRTDKVGFLLVSGGTPSGLGWAWRDPARVAGIAALVPGVDVDYLHDNNIGGLTAAIEAAYAPDYEASRLLYDPAANTALLQPVADRIRLYYSPTDPFVPAAGVLAFAAAVGCEAESIGDVGHVPQAVDPVPIVDWLTATIRANA